MRLNMSVYKEITFYGKKNCIGRDIFFQERYGVKCIVHRILNISTYHALKNILHVRFKIEKMFQVYFMIILYMYLNSLVFLCLKMFLKMP